MPVLSRPHPRILRALVSVSTTPVPIRVHTPCTSRPCTPRPPSVHARARSPRCPSAYPSLYRHVSPVLCTHRCRATLLCAAPPIPSRLQLRPPLRTRRMWACLSRSAFAPRPSPYPAPIIVPTSASARVPVLLRSTAPQHPHLRPFCGDTLIESRLHFCAVCPPRRPRPHDVCIPLLQPCPPLLLRAARPPLASASPHLRPIPAHLVDIYATPFPARHVPVTPSPRTRFRIASNATPSVLPPRERCSYCASPSPIPPAAPRSYPPQHCPCPGHSDRPRWCSHCRIPRRPPLARPSPFPPCVDPPPCPCAISHSLRLHFSTAPSTPSPHPHTLPTYLFTLRRRRLYFYSLLTQYKTIEPTFALQLL
ncbi:hypothetical protein B0H14DRAFT_1127449 [Mycena olivaceomarginata]|nr:hypothetical protein B0H14DRAFT_1127449 [Mycena olivaceomarginata]